MIQVKKTNDTMNWNTIFYDFFVFFSLLFKIPKFLWKKWSIGRPCPPIIDRFGMNIPNPNGLPVIWFHALTIGEVRGAKGIVEKIRTNHPDVFILFTTSCTTGMEELESHFPEISAARYLPFDFSWIIRRWVSKLKPCLLCIMEADIWFHLIHEVKKSGGTVSILNGVLTNDHLYKFNKMRSLYCRILDQVDLLVVQNEEYKHRFSTFASRPALVGGNLKISAKPFPVDCVALATVWGHGPWITIASTQAPEEEGLLVALKPLFSKYRIFLAPRYLVRPSRIYSLLRRLSIPFCTLDRPDFTSPVMFINQMGYLPSCYSLSFAAIIGGSFTKNGRGHNLLEPYMYNCPAIYGKYIANQSDMNELLIGSHGAIQIDSINEVRAAIEDLSNNPSKRKALVDAGQAILEKSKWPLEKSYKLIESVLEKKLPKPAVF